MKFSILCFLNKSLSSPEILYVLWSHLGSTRDCPVLSWEQGLVLLEPMEAQQRSFGPCFSGCVMG